MLCLNNSKISLRIQAGQYSEALGLMQERLADEMDQLGQRSDELADVYQNMALCKSEIDKAHQYMNDDQLDDNKLIVEYGRKCLEYRKHLSGTDNDVGDALFCCFCFSLTRLAITNSRLLNKKLELKLFTPVIRIFHIYLIKFRLKFQMRYFPESV